MTSYEYSYTLKEVIILVKKMPIRIKDRSSIKKLFGLTGGFSAFANNAVIKNNPQLLSILTSKETRIKFKKQDKSIGSKLIIKKYVEKQVSASESVASRATIPPKLGFIYMWKLEEKNRYYKIYLQPNLLGLWSVVCEWGGIKNKIGRFETNIFDRYEEAVDFVNQLNLKRKKKKYELTQII